MNNRWAVGVWVSASLLAGGCGGSSDSGGGGASGSGSGGSGAEISSTAFCQSVGERFCAQDKPCCATLGFPFDEAACQLQFNSNCLANATAVLRGVATLEPQKLDECVQKSQPFYDKCQLTNAEAMQVRTVGIVCNEFFLGTVAPGDACSVDADCAPGAFGSYCQSGMCSQFPSAQTLPEVGDACTKTGADQGLTCSDPAGGVCMPGPPSPIVSADECAGKLMF